MQCSAVEPIGLGSSAADADWPLNPEELQFGQQLPFKFSAASELNQISIDISSVAN